MGATDQGAQLALNAWLVDTGPFVAYLDRADPLHDRVSAALDGFKGQLFTTTAVVTEVMYFLSDVPGGPISFASFLVASDTQISVSMTSEDVLGAAELMTKYADTPMDFADATLIRLGGEVGINDVLTLDRRGFSTYRTTTGRRFRLVLS
jgi:predicted nucleic acid-binding protein